MPLVETDAVVLRAIRYGEADSVLSVYTRERGRASVMAKGVRKATAKLAGRVQPGVWSRLTLNQGRGDMYTLRGAHVVRTHAGLWTDARRLRSAGCVLEAALRVLPEEEANDEAFSLLVNALAVLSESPTDGHPPHLHPVVLAFDAKLLVVSGLLPHITSCVGCGTSPPLAWFSARRGGALCRECGQGIRMDDRARQALVRFLERPLREAGHDDIDTDTALDVERCVTAVLQEHLGVGLRSATPV